MPPNLKESYNDYWNGREDAGPGPGENEIFETVLSVIKPGGALLDAGCGRGAFIKLAAPLFSRLCGTDLAAPAAEAVRALGFEAVEADVSGPLPLAADSFDACTCLDVIEHVIDPLAALKELHRVIKPGGQLVLSTPNIRCFRHIVKLVFSGRFPLTTTYDAVWGGGHLHYFTRADTLQLLESAGFTGATFALNPWQFNRSWKRKLLRLVTGARLFGEFAEGSIVVSCIKRG